MPYPTHYSRSAPAGFECLTLDESTHTLWVMLQNAPIQDGGDDKQAAAPIDAAVTADAGVIALAADAATAVPVVTTPAPRG